MNIIFMRHGEATDNVKELISDREIYWSVLTKKGKETVLDSIKFLPKTIDKIYVSPFPRTIETAHFVYEKHPEAEVIIEQKLHEINNGKYSHQRNNEDLDNTRLKQIAGDYFVRFGEYGENKYDIETRLCEFLKDVYKNNFKDNTVMIVSHGSVTSYMKRILNIKTPHIKAGKIEEFDNVDFNPLFKYIKTLKDIKNKIIKERIDKINVLNINDNLKRNLIKFSKTEFNNIEISNDYFSKLLEGLNTKNLIQKTSSNFDNSIILICFYHNFEKFAKKWINHYINIGIKNFVLVDNNSEDNSTKILKEYQNKLNISFWQINEKYDYQKMCGLKQQILEHYGVGNQYLIVDDSELFIYENYEHISLENFLKKEKQKFIKSLVLEVYPDKQLYESQTENFKFVDKGTYKVTTSVPYKQRFYGGPSFRILNINKSMQKIPFISYTGNEVLINNHYYYPWNVNEKSKTSSYILDYKFLIRNNLSENNMSFYDKNISISISDIDFKYIND